MTTRDQVLAILLWIAVLAQSTWVGGTIYQMLVIVPLWSGSPPDSVRAFFQGTDWNRTIVHFFGPPFMAARTLPVLAALVAGWHRPQHRAALLLAVACLAVTVVFTAVYIYPINAVLFAQAGGSQAAEEIRAMAARWIWADRLRFVIGLVAFGAVLQAFRLPVREPPPGGRSAA